MPDYLIRLAQAHETFRKPELESLAELLDIRLEFLEYSPDSPHCLVRLESLKDAEKLITRSILTDSICELWGQGSDYASLHADVKERTTHRWPDFLHASFRFSVFGYQGKRDTKSHSSIIDSFSYMGFLGPIRMKNADHEFIVFEEYGIREPEPKRIFLGRLVARGSRPVVSKYDLKKRSYISTTSMDAELALITANIAKASAGKLFYDPFMGTGGFPIACAHFGAMCIGSDIDGRTVRATPDRNPLTNFKQYGLMSYCLDNFVSDLTNSPLKCERWLDGIVCDPPYGVREGLKVLGSRTGLHKLVIFEDGTPAHLAPGFIAPKRPYSFDAMLDDILHFAACMLVDNGRLSMWMPTATDEDIALSIPQNEHLELLSSCIQTFNKWSRRLLTYRRLPGSVTGPVMPRPDKEYVNGSTADDLNNFRKMYFEGFRDKSSKG
ncbi:RNA methylase [Microthyrium microscopicum]|uniref:tRNA (guanine(10)-N(2))-methyltransferase n=1 Tax=Microthyrium microscopicum TaxID=703497 RepID=A0A6A6U9P9_9PEZI|nr:RNA methylase [Microthyrium microscopicum]